MEIIISVFLLFVGIAILVIIHICIVGRAYRREFGIDGVPIIKGAGMPVDDLKKLPCFVYNKQVVAASSSDDDDGTNSTDNDSSNNGSSNSNNGAIIDCAVCLESFKVGDTCRMLPNCRHYFHAQCIDVWLSKTPFCPICRTCTIAVAGKLPTPKVGSDGGGAAAAVVATTTNHSIVPTNPAAEELC